MKFRIRALSAARFAHLFGQRESTLAGSGVRRVIANEHPGFPCRVSLRDAEIGESVLLLNYEHQPAESPYRSSHAIYIREWAIQAKPDVNEVPDVLRRRTLSVRAFDAAGMMLDCELVEGIRLEQSIGNLFAAEYIKYLHIHNAVPGCYAALVDRYCPA